MSVGERISVRVGQDEIDIAQRRNKAHCAVAVALATEYPDAQRIMVDRNSICFSDPTTRRRYTYETPRNIQRFLDRFDQELPVDPVNLLLTDEMLVQSKPMAKRNPKRVANPPKPWVPPTDREVRSPNARRVHASAA